MKVLCDLSFVFCSFYVPTLEMNVSYVAFFFLTVFIYYIPFPFLKMCPYDLAATVF